MRGFWFAVLALCTLVASGQAGASEDVEAEARLRAHLAKRAACKVKARPVLRSCLDACNQRNFVPGEELMNACEAACWAEEKSSIEACARAP
jgi:hypothetical protein